MAPLLSEHFSLYKKTSPPPPTQTFTQYLAQSLTWTLCRKGVAQAATGTKRRSFCLAITSMENNLRLWKQT